MHRDKDHLPSVLTCAPMQLPLQLIVQSSSSQLGAIFIDLIVLDSFRNYGLFLMQERPNSGFPANGL